MLMGFLHVHDGTKLQLIWTYPNASKNKNIDVFRRQIWAHMKLWSKDRSISINTSIYLETETVKALVELKFNPGEGVAHLSSASKGLRIMSCHGCTSAQMEHIREGRRHSLPQKIQGNLMNSSVYPRESHGHRRIISGS